MKDFLNKSDQSKQITFTDWQSDFDFDVRFNRKFFTFLGLWPAKTKFEQTLRKCSIILTITFLCVFFIPHGLYVIFVESDNEMRLRMIGPLCFCMIVSGKYIFALLNRSNFAVCVNHMAEDWQVAKAADERLFMLQAGHWTETFTKLCLTFMYTGAISYSVLLPLIEQVVAALSPNDTRTLVFPIYVGSLTVDVATDRELLFDLIFFTLSFSMVVMCTISVGMATFLAKLVMHACGQIRILQKYLMLIDEKDGNVKTGESCQMNFNVIVIKHLRILRFINVIDDALTGICFVECFGSTYAICLLGSYTLTALERHNVLDIIVYSCLLTSFVSNIFIVCFISDRLTEQCRKIGIWTYEVNWSSLLARGESTVVLQIIILVTQNPPQLTAGKIFFLSIESFTSIIKAAATYLNMLRKCM